jgi:hypothetical protein
VRIALERRRLSIKEFLSELPPSMDAAYAAAISPVDANPPRVFIPTRPSLLDPGDSARIFIVFPGQTAIGETKLYSRRLEDTRIPLCQLYELNIKQLLATFCRILSTQPGAHFDVDSPFSCYHLPHLRGGSDSRHEPLQFRAIRRQ